jgi:uncharacterized FlgJ-related protein|tara:strand:+ start:696 stop:1271 length:576 start_codon:yes stop_codon:yes gene_type:complete
MLDINKYLVNKILAFLAIAVFTVHANASDISSKDFALKINQCVETLYADKTTYPTREQIPIELIIAMAAHETAWGKSRFAVEGNNLFGIRTWNSNDPQMKAKGNPDAPWGVKKYKDYCESIEHYIWILSTLAVYEEFRKELKWQNSIWKRTSAIELALYIAPWSEQGEKYVGLIRSIMASLYRKDFFKDIG